MTKHTEGKQCGPGRTEEESDQKGNRDIRKGIVEQGTVRRLIRSHFSADGTALQILDPKVEIREECKENTYRKPRGGERYTERETDDERPYNSEFDIEKHSIITLVKHMVKSKPRRTSPKKALTDEELVRAISTGKKSGYGELIARYRPKLLLYLRHLIGGSDEAEDLLQNVFVKVFEHLGSFDRKRRFSPWIYRITHNEAVNYLKKRNRRRLIAWEDIMTTEDKLETADEKDTPEERWIKRELRDEVRSALDRLPRQHKEVLVLRYYLDKSYAEMSQIISRPENTVASLLNRAKRKLLLLLNEKERG